MSGLIKFARLPLAHFKCRLRPTFQMALSVKLTRQFSWFKPATVEPTLAVTPVNQSIFVISPQYIMKTDQYNPYGDTIIDLFTHTQLRQICQERWKTDFNARRLYTMFYLKYHLYDTDPALRIMAQDLNIYNDEHRNLGYYLTHLLQSHTTIAEQREIMNQTLKDYDNIQPQRRIN